MDDDPSTVELLEITLGREGFKVISAANGISALEIAHRERPHLIVLDRMLPGMNGTEVCRRLRAESDVPILMLTAAGDEIDKVVGLSLGADDYVTKPFSLREVVARVQTLLRRTARPRTEKVLRHGALEVDLVRHRTTVDAAEVQLTPIEFELLRAFLESPERAFSREELLDRVYPNSAAAVGDRAIDVHISNLRKKLSDGSNPSSRIVTVRGRGYKLI